MSHAIPFVRVLANILLVMREWQVVHVRVMVVRMVMGQSQERRGSVAQVSRWRQRRGSNALARPQGGCLGGRHPGSGPVRIQIVLCQSRELVARLGSLRIIIIVVVVGGWCSSVSVVAVARVGSHGGHCTVGRRRQESTARRVIALSRGDAISGRGQ